jgi:hypothetical protein
LLSVPSKRSLLTLLTCLRSARQARRRCVHRPLSPHVRVSSSFSRLSLPTYFSQGPVPSWIRHRRGLRARAPELRLVLSIASFCGASSPAGRGRAQRAQLLSSLPLSSNQRLSPFRRTNDACHGEADHAREWVEEPGWGDDGRDEDRVDEAGHVEAAFPASWHEAYSTQEALSVQALMHISRTAWLSVTSSR